MKHNNNSSLGAKLKPELQGDGGQAGGEIWVYIEFIVARLPTLRIRGEKKVAKMPEI